MKILKKTRVLLVFLSMIFLTTFFISCSNNNVKDDIFDDMSENIIGTLDKNQETLITFNHDLLLDKYNNLAKELDISKKFTRLEIKKFIDNKNEIYALCAYSDDSVTRMATLLVLTNDNTFKIYYNDKNLKYSDYEGSITCTTTDCSGSTGCSPINDGLGWKCSDCPGTCTKTTTVQL